MRLTMQCADCGRLGPVLNLGEEEYSGVPNGNFSTRPYGDEAKWIVRTETSDRDQRTRRETECVCPRCQRERAKETT